MIKLGIFNRFENWNTLHKELLTDLLIWNLVVVLIGLKLIYG